MNPAANQRLQDVDIRLIRVFCAVVRCGGMTAAELELNIGRSTISRHVKDLEARLGTTLCRRGRSGFALTAEGQHVYQAAERMMAALDEFQGEVSGLNQALNGNLNGNLSIALFDKTATNPAANIHQAIALFHEQAPAVSLHIHVEPINDIERQVIDGTYQLGIIPTHRNSSSLSYLSLFDEQMYLYCGHQHPLFNARQVTNKQILDSNYAGMGFHSPNMEVGRQLGWQRMATAYDQEAIATLIQSGCFLGFLPEHYAEQFVERGQMKRIGGRKFQYNCEFVAIYRRSPSPSRLLATFIDCLTRAHPAIIEAQS